MVKAKIAEAVRKGGDVYDVFYPGRASMDRDVGWAYVRGLLVDGYTVHLDQTGHCPEGEKPRQTYTPDA